MVGKESDLKSDLTPYNILDTIVCSPQRRRVCSRTRRIIPVIATLAIVRVSFTMGPDDIGYAAPRYAPFTVILFR